MTLKQPQLAYEDLQLGKRRRTKVPQKKNQTGSTKFNEKSLRKRENAKNENRKRKRQEN